jgi:hypothetical protein
MPHGPQASGGQRDWREHGGIATAVAMSSEAPLMSLSQWQALAQWLRANTHSRGGGRIILSVADIFRVVDHHLLHPRNESRAPRGACWVQVAVAAQELPGARNAELVALLVVDPLVEAPVALARARRAEPAQSAASRTSTSSC